MFQTIAIILIAVYGVLSLVDSTMTFRETRRRVRERRGKVSASEGGGPAEPEEPERKAG